MRFEAIDLSVRFSYILTVIRMAEIVGITKVTKKGTVTLPSELRQIIDIDEDDYLFVINLKGLIILQRVEKPPSEEVAAIIRGKIDEALRNLGKTPEDVTQELRKIRRDLRAKDLR